MKILVTGGAGFIGSHLCEALLERKNYVICADNFDDFYDPAMKEDNISDIQDHHNFELLRGDIRDTSFLSKIFSKQIDLVVHLAAMAGVRPSIKNPQKYIEVNINGTANILEQCRKKNIGKFIFASSSSVYGNNKKIPFAEKDNVDYPISPYAATKKAGELICYNYYHLFNISTVCLRFFTVYGPRQRPDLAIHKFTKRIMMNKSIPVYGDGTTKRDYTYIDDIIDGLLKTINFLQSNGSLYEIFNLGESKTISLRRMISTIEKITGLTAKLEYMKMFPGDVYQTYADIDKSVKLLKYSPEVDFEEGIKRFVYWIKKKQGV